MEFRFEEITSAMRLLRAHAMLRGSVLSLTRLPEAVFMESGMDHASASALVHHLQEQGLLVVGTDSTGPTYQLAFREESSLFPRRIAVFIDLENVQKHLEPHRDVISVHRIEAALRELGEVHVIYAFLDVTRGPHEVVGDLDANGVVIVHCKKYASPRGGLEDTVDERLKQHVRRTLAHPDITTIAIATNDNGFRDIMQEVRRQRREAILLIAEPEVSAELQRAADRVLPIGSVFMREVASCARAIGQCDRDGATMDGIAADYRYAFDALCEIIHHAMAIGRTFAPKYLRDRIQGDTQADLPHVATIEEMLRCVFLLQDMRCFLAVGERGTKLVLNREHPFVLHVVGGADRPPIQADVEQHIGVRFIAPHSG